MVTPDVSNSFSLVSLLSEVKAERSGSPFVGSTEFPQNPSHSDYLTTSLRKYLAREHGGSWLSSPLPQQAKFALRIHLFKLRPSPTDESLLLHYQARQQRLAGCGRVGATEAHMWQ